MDTFTILSVRALNEKNDHLKKRIVKKCGILPKDLYKIVLEYSHIGDAWLAPGYFNNIIVETDTGVFGRDIQIFYDVIIGPCIVITLEIQQPFSDSPDTPISYRLMAPIVEFYEYIFSTQSNIRVRGIDAPVDKRDIFGRAFVSFMVELLIWSK